MVKKKEVVDQVIYLGRYVNREHFRAWVYDANGDQKLADDFNEFEDLLATGLWFAEKQEAQPKVEIIKSVAKRKRRQANGSDSEAVCDRLLPASECELADGAAAR